MAEGNLLPISVFRCSLFSELRWLAFTWGKAAGCCWQLPPPSSPAGAEVIYLSQLLERLWRPLGVAQEYDSVKRE